jgi:hypothetical protein
MIEVDVAIVGGGCFGGAALAAAPPVRGSRFEATAVPELRMMAELVAAQIAHASSSDLSQVSLGAYS